MAPISVAPSEELRNLNNRLSVYIDRVRCSQVEKMMIEEKENRINEYVNKAKETTEKEVMRLKNLYESELAEARSLIDDTAKENAKLHLDSQRLGKEVGHLKNELEKLNHKCNKTDNELACAQKKIVQLETKNNELIASLQQLQIEMEMLRQQAQEITLEKEELKKQIPDLQRQLESEILSRTDLENRNQTLKENLEFRQELFEQEMNELRKDKDAEINAMKSQIEGKHEMNVQTSLEELRELYEVEAKKLRDDITSRFEGKILELEEDAEKQRNMAISHYEELRQTQACLGGFKTKLSDLESSNSCLKRRVNDLEEVLEKETKQHTKAMAACREEIKRLNEKFNMQLQKTLDLTDNQESLRKEIEHYRQLLEGEESRLNLTPKKNLVSHKRIERNSVVIELPAQKDVKKDLSTARVSQPDSPLDSAPIRPVKRRRTSDASSSSSADIVISSRIKGDIRLTDVDSPKKCIRLRQRGDKKTDLIKQRCIIM